MMFLTFVSGGGCLRQNKAAGESLPAEGMDKKIPQALRLRLGFKGLERPERRF